MSAKFFGQYLLEKGKISPQQLMDAVSHQKGIHAPLGALAMEIGMLNAAQVKKVHEQQKKTDRRFGELAVDMGFLVQPQVDQLLEAQSHRKVLLGEALVLKGYITVEDLEKELKSYKEEQEKISSEVSTFLSKVLHHDVVEVFVDLVIKMFARFGKQTLKIEQCEMGKKKLRLMDYVVSQKIEGDLMELNFLLCVPQAFLVTMASTMMNKSISKVDDLVKDAAMEFVNITTGNACAKLSGKSINFKMQPPQMNETSKQPYPTERANEIVCVHLTSQDNLQVDLGFEF